MMRLTVAAKNVKDEEMCYLNSAFEEHLHHLGVLVDDGDGERRATERIDTVEVELRPCCRARLSCLEAPDDLCKVAHYSHDSFPKTRTQSSKTCLSVGIKKELHEGLTTFYC